MAAALLIARTPPSTPSLAASRQLSTDFRVKSAERDLARSLCALADLADRATVIRDFYTDDGACPRHW